MKKIKLNETDLMKIVKRALNEQYDRQFDEDEIDILHFIFERELKPPFSKGDKDSYGRDTYNNRDGEYIGRLVANKRFIVEHDPLWLNIKDKVCQVFGFPYDTYGWWFPIKPHLISWLEDQLNIELRNI